MGEKSEFMSAQESVPVINLREAPGERVAWGRPKWVVYTWGLAEAVFVTNPLQISSTLRVAVLRLFGAKIGDDVIFRQRTRVKFPWKLRIGDRSWIGEGVWLHNQDQVEIGSDVVISQEAFITTGSHALRSDMALIMKPVKIEDGAWITTRCIILGGSTIGKSAVVGPNSVVGPNAVIGENTVVTTASNQVIGPRFPAIRGE